MVYLSIFLNYQYRRWCVWRFNGWICRLFWTIQFIIIIFRNFFRFACWCFARSKFTDGYNNFITCDIFVWAVTRSFNDDRSLRWYKIRGVILSYFVKNPWHTSWGLYSAWWFPNGRERTISTCIRLCNLLFFLWRGNKLDNSCNLYSFYF